MEVSEVAVEGIEEAEEVFAVAVVEAVVVVVAAVAVEDSLHEAADVVVEVQTVSILCYNCRFIPYFEF